MSPTPYGRIFPPNTAWLAKLPAEAVLEPELPIIDTHHHLWDRLSADLPGEPGNNQYLPEEFLTDLRSGHNTVATVFLQCHTKYRVHGPEEFRPVGETEFAAGIAAMSDSGAYGPTRICQGIVGFADLTLGDRVTPVLEAHIRAGGGRFRGVRNSGGWDVDPIIGNSATDMKPHLYERADFRAGLARLSALGLSLDAWVYHPQLPDVTSLARSFPATNIIMGHCGGPLGYGSYAGKRDEVFAQWKKSVTELARCPNVTMKLGGTMMRLAAYDYLNIPTPPSSAEMAALWRPFMETCIELFGPKRCMFESNFPVEKMGTSWVTLWNAFKRIAAGASHNEKEAMFNGTARRVYRLQGAQ